MPQRMRRNRGLARPEKSGSGALHGRAARAPREGRCQQLQRPCGLLGDNTVAERGELSRSSEPRGGGDPAFVEALQPLDEVGTEPAARVGGHGRGTGEHLPPGDGCRVGPPSLVCVPACGAESVQSGRTTADRGGRQRLPGLRPGVPVSLALGVGSSDAAALGRVMSPLP